MSRISIIIPLYNKASYVVRSLESVVQQSYNDWELWVIDDGSTDDSYAVVKNFLQNQASTVQVKCQLIRQSNHGVSYTRNYGVSLAHGDWIAFLDADDWWHTDFLKKLLPLTEEYPNAGICGCNYTIVDGNRTRVANIGIADDFVAGDINYFEVYAKTFYMPLCIGSNFIHKTLFLQLGGFNECLKLGEDFDLWLRIALHYPVIFLNQSLAYYNQELPLNDRAVGNLFEPRYNFLFNLNSYSQEEQERPDVKRLFDVLRVYGLFNYYLDRRYHQMAKDELQKVDWNLVNPKWQKLYRLPLVVLKIRQFFIHHAVLVKKMIRR